MNEKVDLLEFLPQHIASESGTQHSLQIKHDEDYLYLSYQIAGGLGGYYECDTVFPRFISKNIRTFEVIGLLQAEMGKKDHGTLSFTNHEYKLMNYVLRWFEKELELKRNQWKWAITVNINKPENEAYRREVENRVISHWIQKTGVPLERTYPVKVWYIKDTENKVLKPLDYGSLVIKYRNNLFSQVIKRLVKTITYEKILTYGKEFIRAYMRGIIAGEGCVQNDRKTGHYSVHLTSTYEAERMIYNECLKNLGILPKIYNNYKDLLISNNNNLLQLLNQRIMTLSPQKYGKFLQMMQQFPKTSQVTPYFRGKGKNVWNKIPQEKIDIVLNLYLSGIIRTTDISKKVGISKIKIRRILKEHNLGKRLTITDEALRKEIAYFAQNNLMMSQLQIAQKFHVHESVVVRACKKYGVKRGQQARRRIPMEKIQQILDIYHHNPYVTNQFIMGKVGVSNSVIKRVCREHHLIKKRI